MKKLLALLLTLVLVMSIFAACDSKKDKDDEGTTEATEEAFDIKGDWSSEMNLGELIGVDTDTPVKYTMSFGDGEGTMVIDEESYADASIEYTKEAAVAEGSTWEDELAEMGMTEESLREQLISSMEGMLSTTFEYSVNGDTITLDGEECTLDIKSNDEIVITDSDDIAMTLTRK